jgi:multidrug efflux pump subunit AcrA (membrane-fusion protein)
MPAHFFDRIVMRSSTFICALGGVAIQLVLTVDATAQQRNLSAGSKDLPPAAIVTVAKAINACFSETVRGAGFLVARSEATVLLDADGSRVSEVLVTEGGSVAAGQILAKVIRPEMPPSTPRAVINLLAPAAGVVIRSNAVLGATASPMGEPLFRIMVDNLVELEAEIPGLHLTKLKPGQTARVDIVDGPSVNGKVRLVPAEVSQRTQLGRIRLSFDGGNLSSRVGAFAAIAIDASRSCGPGIPRSAVAYAADGSKVQIVRDGVIEIRHVRAGLFSDELIEIREGVREGDVVVANAANSLHNGDKINPSFADEARPR